MRALEVLQEKLVGNFYERFAIGDTYDLFFHNFWLIARNVVCADEEFLNRLPYAEYEAARDAVDRESVAKGVMLCALFRCNIIKVHLSDDSTLQLTFENGMVLCFPTDTGIVDWQWALNEKGDDPYFSHIVACFGPGDVHIDDR